MPYNWGEPPAVGQANPRHIASLAVPFFHVSDIEASLRFYVDGLGFVLTNQWSPEGRIRWCWLELDRVAIMLQEFSRGEGSRGGSSPGISICIFCEDAISIFRDLRTRGIAVSRPFVGNGLWVTSVADPDGYRIDFESPAEAPEETVFEG